MAATAAVIAAAIMAAMVMPATAGPPYASAKAECEEQGKEKKFFHDVQMVPANDGINTESLPGAI
jgi:hypothetical protein